ncbi:MAG: hypothetical protein ACRCSQ_05280 [Bacteroidales bacterium]
MKNFKLIVCVALAFFSCDKENDDCIKPVQPEGFFDDTRWFHIASDTLSNVIESDLYFEKGYSNSGEKKFWVTIKTKGAKPDGYYGVGTYRHDFPNIIPNELGGVPCLIDTLRFVSTREMEAILSDKTRIVYKQGLYN